MMMSRLPQADRFRLLALGIFMDLSGKGNLPETAGLTAFGPSQDAWDSLLSRAIATGWLTRIDGSLYVVSVPTDPRERQAEASR
jgi:hypothetical protein